MFKDLLSKARRTGLNGLRDEVVKPFRPVPAARPDPAAPAGIKHIELDYEVFPRPRPLRAGPGGQRMLAQLEGSVEGARGLVGEFARFQGRFQAIPVQAAPDPADPHWMNGWFPSFDAIMLYGLLATRNPRRYVEVGSGNSTRFARRAVR
ncbi:MAG: hypothetical protein EXS08_17145, partial [Planctomycetes bacterium]|nr:hypothetical protein [Planctomycetota bacterium]